MFRIIIFIFLAIPARQVQACRENTLETRLGSITGCEVDTYQGSYITYSGIPYAIPPLGDLRFRPTSVLREWPGRTLKSSAVSPICPQKGWVSGEVIGDEDCLYLNIFSPSVATKDINSCPRHSQEHHEDCFSKRSELAGNLPVMVYIHGGGFTNGDADPAKLNPEMLVAKNVIVVTLTYRLGALGFFTLLTEEAPGNLGIRDMVVALDWLQENIEDYGGDKNKITLFGNSAGSSAISVLLTIEQAVFHQAILQSGTLVKPFYIQNINENITALNLQFADQVGCHDAENVVKCLKGKPVEDLVEKTDIFASNTVWQPVIDTILGDLSIMPVDQLTAFKNGDYKKVNVIMGTTNGDGLVRLEDMILNQMEFYTALQENFSRRGSLLVLGKNSPNDEDIRLIERLRYFYTGKQVLTDNIDKELVQLMTDSQFQAGTRQLLEIMFLASPDQTVYQYNFNYVGTVSNTEQWFGQSRPELGACHADELLYLFKSTGQNNLVTTEDNKISETLIEFWTNFAKTGNPNSVETDVWHPLNRESSAYLSINAELKMELPLEYLKKTVFWNSVFNPTFNQDKPGLGTIKGSYLTTTSGRCIRAYQGIPYAQPPIGNLRFLDPKPASPWDGTLDATNLGAMCMQRAGNYPSTEEMSEDCLFLNIYTPCDSIPDLPVLVYIHGGGLAQGSGGNYFHGPEYLLENNQILVTVNYRLSPFSFISLESSVMPGNQGFKDQRLALQWIQEHIEVFDGDKNSVTLFGESAGALSVTAHLATKLSDGLFHRAIAQSTGIILRPVKDVQDGDLRETVHKLAAELKCPKTIDDEIVLKCLQGVEANVLLEKAQTISDSKYFYNNDWKYSTNPFFHEDPVTAFQTGSFYKVPLLIGVNSEEGIYNAAPYITNNTKLMELLDNWSLYGTQLIFKKCCSFTEEELSISEAIRKFYFDTENQPINGLINFLSDEKFWVGSHRLVTLLSDYVPVYEYVLSHVGSFSFTYFLGINSTEYGVCHGDDLQYIFNPHVVEFPTLLTAQDHKVSDIIVRMWTNFGFVGNPTPEIGETEFVWYKFTNSEPQYLEIMENPEMKFSPQFKARMDFWEGLLPLTPKVTLGSSQIFGTWGTTDLGKKFKMFRGVKYADVPKRFMDAELVDEYPGMVVADEEGSMCPQIRGGYKVPSSVSEDCLYLNIYTPSQAESLPVMVWIHGGAFVRGSGGNYFYGPEYVMEQEGIIVVTLNYRMGAFGFLSLESETAPGNMAIRDQNLALVWVQRNIASFGGNPGDVTVWGESAGAFSVGYHLISPASAGLFHKAIAQSGSPVSPYFGTMPRGKARRVAVDLARSLGCSTETDKVLIDCLSAVPVDDIINSKIFCTGDYICTLDPWNVVVDARTHPNPILLDTPQNMIKYNLNNKVPTIIGLNSEEGIYSAGRYIKNHDLFSELNDGWGFYGPLFVFDTADPSPLQKDLAILVRDFYLKDNVASMDNIHDIIDMFSDIIFFAGVHRYTLLAANQIQTVYLYQLTQKSKNSYADLVLGIDSESLGLGVCHADDLFVLFKNHLWDLSFTNDDMRLRNLMTTWWVNFAKTGSAPAGEAWTPFDLSSPAYFNINTSPAMEYSERYMARMNFWMMIMDQLNF